MEPMPNMETDTLRRKVKMASPRGFEPLLPP